MARLTTDGLREAEQELQKLARDLRGRCMRDMLNAGADVLVDAWKASILAKRHVRTHAMYDNVSKTDIRIDTDGMSIEVYPQGTDSHRITNAQKAFILNSGRQPNKRGKKGIKGDHFVTDAENAARDKVTAAMQAVLDRYVSGKD